ncbi:aromatic-ring-hydroxylating dioxygenase subunit beta [Streptomyces sp. NPDC086766]|uniref:aromatic-ring-hydroxylating dioxygenase subunit beta n=1 Tax=Streptomyces sp. NPDC086766 TaxID=3365754 RepID=UPI00382E23B2
MTTTEDTTLLPAVQQFLYAEAALLDAEDFPAWLKLFTTDAVYWIPAIGDNIDPSREVSIVHDDVAALSERVWRFDSGLAYAQEPRSRTAHLVTNVRLLDVQPSEGGVLELEVEAGFLIAEFRRGARYQHAGRYEYRLHREDGEFRIRRKKVELINNDGYFGNLSLLL